ncbi:MAG: hypothetical protein JW795_08850 [Chitinivibrionales bacterium]|nr:hypothetical protein [Chitinivibrionales bacterium]
MICIGKDEIELIVKKDHSLRQDRRNRGFSGARLSGEQEGGPIVTHERGAVEGETS